MTLIGLYCEKLLQKSGSRAFYTQQNATYVIIKAPPRL